MVATSKELKGQLAVATISVFLSLLALSTATFAWFSANNTVKATSSTISAKSNDFVLQIARLDEGAQHGGNQSLVAVTKGHTISPSSTSDTKTWYVCQGWGQDGKVYTYSKPDTLQSDGSYQADTTHYAYIKSEYVLYTINETGSCDVYLDGSDDAVQVTAKGKETSTVIPDSMRVGITIEDLSGTTQAGNERLMLVYAPKEVTGKGNDATAIDGWACVKDESHVMSAPYPHLENGNYIYTDALGTKHDFAATKNAGSDSYEAPTENATPLATGVGYDGVIMRVYIWLEGTDADCVNNSNQDDPSTYDVTISLAGIAVA